MTAPKIAEDVQTITIHATDRPAIRPARAASAPLATPVTSNATISGITVILRALSHSPPTMFEACSEGLAQAVAERGRTGPSEQSEHQRDQHIISASAATLSAAFAATLLAQRGFLKR